MGKVVPFPHRVVRQLTDNRLRLMEALDKRLNKMVEEVLDDLEDGAEYVGTELRIDHHDRLGPLIVREGEESWRRRNRPRRVKF